MQKLGKYEILAELGHGAMGVVYKARDPFIGRLVALKTINSNLVDRPDLLERFYQEAQSAGKLQHPNIVTIFELGQEKDTPFIAMEYLDGESLEKTIVRQTDLPLALKVGYIARICRALEYAHKNRVVHRDIKPGNIMVNSEGVVKVVDFGIARLVDFSRTHTNMMIGTPAYMAPELFRKKKADERTDIWAAGVTFYELICYQRPFTGEGYDIIRTIMEDEFEMVSSVVPECPAEVEAIIQRMLRKQPTERYQSMEDVLLDLEPVWNRLRSSAATVMAERAREFYEMGDLPKAHEVLHRARQIDNSNAQAKSLFEKISAELRRTEIQPKVQEHLNRGQIFLQSGQFREAQAEVDAALGLDSRNEPAHKLAAEVETGAARAQQLEQKLRLTKQRLAEGALVEAESALRQALELDPGHPQVIELKRQLGEEQNRRERRKQLGELLHKARVLWTELKYEECLALIAEGLKAFPNESELKSLQETAQADWSEQKKQGNVAEVRRLLGQRKLSEARKALDILSKEQPADTVIKNLQALLTQEEQEEKRKKRLEQEIAGLRNLLSAGKLREAVSKGEALLKEFPQEYEISDLVKYAKSEVAQQEQKKNEQESEKQIRGLLEDHRYREAADVARRALQQFPKQEMFHRLVTEAEAKSKEQQEREEAQREIQQRIQEIRGKIKRQELTDAIDLARQTLATLGPSTDVTKLLQAAEVEVGERNKKIEQGARQLETARALLEKGDLSGARQVLDRAIATRIVSAADAQIRALQSQIAQKEKLLRGEEDRKRKESQESSTTQTNVEGEASRRGEHSAEEATRLLGTPTVPPRNMPPASAPLSAQSATSISGAAVKKQTSVPVATPLPTVPPQAPATDIEIRTDGNAPTASGKRPSSGPLPALLATAGIVVVLAGGIYGAIRFVRREPAKPSAADLAIEAEAKQLWNDHKMDDSLADWKKLAGKPGLLHDEAVQQVSEIEQKHVAVEQLYAQGMKLLYEEKKYPEAAEKFNEVLQMNLWKMDETRKEFEIASKRPDVVVPVKPPGQDFLNQGKQAFAKRDYAGARNLLERASSADGVSRDINDQAQRYLAMIRNREEQRKALDQALQLERGGQKQQAKDLFEQVATAPNGDSEIAATAKNHISQIAASAQPANTNGGANTGANTGTNAGKNPPDYGPALGDVRGLIAQGRWDDADAKLNGIPPTAPNYSDLKQQISNGRRDDLLYSQEKALFQQADASKNKNALRSLRPFFMAEANKVGRRGGDARNVVNQIDLDLRAPDVTASNGGRGAGDDAPHLGEFGDIKAAINAYAKALDNGDQYALRAVAQVNAKDEQKMPGILNAIRGKGYMFQNCSTPEVNGPSAKVTCDAILANVPGSKKQKTKIQLAVIGGRWMIVSTSK